MKLTSLAMASLILVFSAAVRAEELPPLPPPAPELVAFSNRLDQHQLVFLKMDRQWRKLFFNCMEGLSSSNWVVAESFEVKFDSSGTPIEGAWFDEATVSGCGESRKLSVLSAVFDGKIVRLSSLPGTTYADFILQHDSIPAAIALATETLPNQCLATNPADAIIDTHFLKFTGPPYPGAEKGHGRPWREEWIVSGCQARAAVTMHFVPDANGTRFTAESAKLLPLEP